MLAERKHCYEVVEVTEQKLDETVAILALLTSAGIVEYVLIPLFQTVRHMFMEINSPIFRQIFY